MRRLFVPLLISSLISKSMTAAKSTKVGFIGLGIMGKGMSRCILQDSSTNLLVWNRSPESCNELKNEYDDDRVSIAESAAQVVSESDITFLMLSTPEACANVYNAKNGVLDGVSSGKMLVDCATLRVSDMKGFYDNVKSKGGKFLEAPVSGSKGPAETGTLIFLSAGDEEVLKAAEPYLEKMGKASHYFGDIGEGTKMKLIVNGLMANMLAALGESMLIAEEQGLDKNKMLEVLSQGAMANPMFGLKGPSMADPYNNSFNAAFPLKHALKDLAFSIDELESSGEFDISRASRKYYDKAIELGLADNDFSAVIKAQKK